MCVYICSKDTYVLVRVQEHEDDHHAVVGRPPQYESDHYDDADPERLDLRPLDETAPVDVVLAHGRRRFRRKHFVTF